MSSNQYSYEKLGPYSAASAPIEDYGGEIPIATADVIEPVPVNTIETVTASAVSAVATAVAVENLTNSNSISSASNIQVQNNMGREPVNIQCPFCNQSGMTRVRDVHGSGSFFWGLCCCIIGCWPCAFLPCCVSSVRIFEIFYD